MSFTTKEKTRFKKIIAMIDNQDYSTAADFLAAFSDMVTVNEDIVIPPELLEELEADEIRILTEEEVQNPSPDMIQVAKEAREREEFLNGLQNRPRDVLFPIQQQAVEKECDKHKGKGKHPKIEIEIEIGESKEDSEVNVLLPDIQQADDDLKEQENTVEQDLIGADEGKDYIENIVSLLGAGEIEGDGFHAIVKSQTPNQVDLIFNLDEKYGKYHGYTYTIKGTAIITKEKSEVEIHTTLNEEKPVWLSEDGFFRYNNTSADLFDRYTGYMTDPKETPPDKLAFVFINTVIFDDIQEMELLLKGLIDNLIKLKNNFSSGSGGVNYTCDFIVPTK